MNTNGMHSHSSTQRGVPKCQGFSFYLNLSLLDPLQVSCFFTSRADICIINSFWWFRLRGGRSGSDSQQDRILLIATTTRPDLGPTQHPDKWVPMFFSWGETAEAWFWPLISICCRGWECMELNFHSVVRLAWCLVKLKDNFTLTYI
jgi:hypothetical protein